MHAIHFQYHNILYYTYCSFTSIYLKCFLHTNKGWQVYIWSDWKVASMSIYFPFLNCTYFCNRKRALDNCMQEQSYTSLYSMRVDKCFQCTSRLNMHTVYCYPVFPYFFTIQYLLIEFFFYGHFEISYPKGNGTSNQLKIFSWCVLQLQ